MLQEKPYKALKILDKRGELTALSDPVAGGRG